MPLQCPTCSMPNPDGAEACLRCGKTFVQTMEMPSDHAFDSERGSPATVVVKSVRESNAGSGLSREACEAATVPSASGRIAAGDAADDVGTDTPPPERVRGSGSGGVTNHGSRGPAPVTLRESPRNDARGTTANLGAHPTDAGSDHGSAATAHDAAPATVVAAPRLHVVRGERLNVEYPILEGKNYIGRSADKPVDIDLDGQEALERIWTSRQHAVISLEAGVLVLEDLNSLNGTFVNRTRIHPAQQRVLSAGDIVQIGTVQMKVLV